MVIVNVLFLYFKTVTDLLVWVWMISMIWLPN